MSSANATKAYVAVGYVGAAVAGLGCGVFFAGAEPFAKYAWLVALVGVAWALGARVGAGAEFWKHYWKLGGVSLASFVVSLAVAAVL